MEILEIVEVSRLHYLRYAVLSLLPAESSINSLMSFSNLTSKDLSREDISSVQFFPAISSKADNENRLKNSARIYIISHRL